MLTGYDTPEAVCGELMEENRKLSAENKSLKEKIKILQQIIKVLKGKVKKRANVGISPYKN